MKIKKHIILALLLVSSGIGFAQKQTRDQDLLTLRNGFQYLGYIIEQQPGKLLKMYRPNQNDTVSVNLEDIDKITKVMVNPNATAKEKKKDSTMTTGRYNNKKNVFQFSYSVLGFDDRPKFHHGGTFAYYRSFKNQYFMGFSAGFHTVSYNSIYYDTTGITGTIKNNYKGILPVLMFENKFRVGGNHPQNKRLYILINANIGYVFDRSVHTEEFSSDTDDDFTRNSYEYAGNFIFNTGVNFKINPDNNSGFILEPGITYYRSYRKEYFTRINKDTGDILVNRSYQGYYKEFPLIFYFRLGYFF